MILVGVDTAIADDPILNCRLPGLEQRSPIRLVLDSSLKLPLDSKLVRSSEAIPLWLACCEHVASERRYEMQAAGCRIVAAESDGEHIALPELMDDLAAQGISSVLVEGGASVAKSFLKEKLVDRLILFHSPVEIGATIGVAVTGLQSHIDNEFTILRRAQYGDDACIEYVRNA